MKNARPSLSARYLAALHRYLRAMVPRHGDRVQGLRRSALTAGSMTRELAVMRERAVVVLLPVVDLSNLRGGATVWAEIPFATEG